jgi:DNA-binding NtrC family response regulator
MARGVILSKGRRLTPEDLPETMRPDGGEAGNGPRGKALIGSLPQGGVTLRTLEMELIQKTLEQCGGNKSLAARHLGISRKALYEKLERYGIPAG